MVWLALGLGGNWNPNVHQPEASNTSQFRQDGSIFVVVDILLLDASGKTQVHI